MGGKKGGIDLDAGKSSQEGAHSCRGAGAGGEHVAQRPLQVPGQKLYVISCEHAEMGEELTEMGEELTEGLRGASGVPAPPLTKEQEARVKDHRQKSRLSMRV